MNRLSAILFAVAITCLSVSVYSTTTEVQKLTWNSATNSFTALMKGDSSKMVMEKVSPTLLTYIEWNPSGTGPVDTDPSVASLDPIGTYVTHSGPTTGTSTFTFSRIGWYVMSVTLYHNHQNAYTQARFSVTIGGTALTKNQGIQTWAAGDVTDDTSNSETRPLFVKVSAPGQTVTFRPKYQSDGISNTSQHQAGGSIVIYAL